MKLVDTHTHLYEEQFDTDHNEMIQRAIDAGVATMLIPNVDTTTVKGYDGVSPSTPNHIFPMMGLHPCYVKPETTQTKLEIIRKYLFENEQSAERSKC